MSSPVAIRFDDALLAEVRQVARRRSTSVSAVVQGFTEEGIRGQRVAGIVFRDGPAGRRPGVAGSLDVWEIVAAVRGMEHRDTVAAAAELGVAEAVVRTALDYYGRYPDEIDVWIADNECEAAAARAAWDRALSA